MESVRSPLSDVGKYREIVFAVVLFLIFDLGVLVLSFYISSRIQQDAVGINLAGRQRMLSQRMVKTLLEIDQAQQLGISAAVARDELLLTYRLFDGTLVGFERGGQVIGGDGKPVSLRAVDGAKAKELVAQANGLWLPYKTKLAPILSATPTLTPDAQRIAVEYALAYNLKLLDLMNSLTSELEQVAANRATMLRKVQAGAIILALVNFIVILMHFLRKLRAQDAQLAHYSGELEKLVDVRTRELDATRVQLARYTGVSELDEAELSRRRRAIYRGLEGLLSPEQTLKALCIWEERYSHGAAFALFEFVNHVTKSLRVAAARGSIHQSLVRSMLLPTEALGADPALKMQRYRKRRPAIVSDYEMNPA